MKPILVPKFRLELLVVFLVAFLIEAASANEISHYSSRLWQTSEDFSRNAIQAIAQTPDGFLWVGSQRGLARFDGEQFEFFSVGAKADPLAQRVNALCVDGDGWLWVGTPNGLFQWRGKKRIAHGMPAPAAANILSLRSSRDGSVGIGTGSGLVLWRNEKLTLVGNRNAPSGSSEQSTATHSIRAMAGNERGELWVNTASLAVLLRDGMAITNHSFAAFRPDFMRAVCSTRDGGLWVGANSGLIRFQDGHYTHFTKTNGLPDETVTSVYEDHRGNLWIGTFGGLCRFVAGKFIIETTVEGEPYDQIFCFFEDRENNLWVGTKDGLHQVTVRQFTTYTTRHGLAHNNVVSVYEDSAGTMWIGTWGGGLHSLRDGKMTIYSTANTPVLRNDKILGIHGTRDGSLWFGEDYDGGLYRLRDGVFQHYGEQQGVVRNAIRALLEDRSGRLLIARATGYMNVLENGIITAYDRRQGLLTNAMRCLLQTQDGRIWIGSESGLSYWVGDQILTLTKNDGLSDSAVLSAHEDKEGDVWLGTGNGGLNRMRRKESGIRSQESTHSLLSPVSPLRSPSFTFYGGRHGLPDRILEIVEDDEKNLWLASHSGVYRVPKKDLDEIDAGKIQKASVMAFGKADGMSSQVCVGVAKPSAFKSRDGRLWFATTKGLAVADPKLKIGRNEVPPPVVVRAVIADKKTVSGKVGKWVSG